MSHNVKLKILERFYFSNKLCLLYAITLYSNPYLNIFLFCFHRHVASFLSVFKLLVIGLIIIGRDPFALFGMQAPGMWEWGQGNKVRFPGIKTVSLWERFYCSVFMCNSVLDGRLWLFSRWSCTLFWQVIADSTGVGSM